jgi:tetratricopeptide (TPR) repeat protein
MKKIFVLTLVLLIPLAGMTQGRKYNKSMEKAIELMQTATEREESLECAGRFEEIALKYPGQWIPYYYASQILTTLTMGEQDIKMGDAQLDRSESSLEKALELNPEESELHTLEALLLVARMSLDPYSRGPMYYEDYMVALQKAKQLNPENPRIYFLEGMIALNLPDYMGGGPAAAKSLFQEAEKKFSAFRNDDPFWPGWGADLNREQLSNLE